jgi:hypothetical protein
MIYPDSRWALLGGRGRIRLRESHVRDNLGPLITAKAVGAAKLDVALRGLAQWSPGSASHGYLPEAVSWEDLHDLVRDGEFYANNRDLKRKWVGEQLARLEKVRLIDRQPAQGRRPRLLVLSDRGDRSAFDDPGGAPDDSYVTLFGTLYAFGTIRGWGGPELAGYIAAMIAERYARSDSRFSEVAQLRNRPLGAGLWYRPLTWFADSEHKRPPHHVRIDFAERTLRRGFSSLRAAGLIRSEWIDTDPRTGQPFLEGPRVLYHNLFDDVRPEYVRRRPWQGPFQPQLRSAAPSS